MILENEFHMTIVDNGTYGLDIWIYFMYTNNIKTKRKKKRTNIFWDMNFILYVIFVLCSSLCIIVCILIKTFNFKTMNCQQ